MLAGALLGVGLPAPVAIGQDGALSEAVANILPNWQISGSNTLRFEEYIVSGDSNASPYPFRGLHPYNDISLSISKR